MKKKFTAKERQAFLKALEGVWNLVPELRFFQFVEMLKEGLLEQVIDPIYMDDKQYMENLVKVVSDRRKKKRGIK